MPTSAPCPSMNYDIQLGGDIDGAIRSIFPPTGRTSFWAGTLLEPAG
ncbi:MAG: hypothetical protein R2857_01880 [Vampirovibrionales bacterium]